MSVPSSVLARAVPSTGDLRPPKTRWLASPVVAVLTLLTSLMALVAAVGGDARWLAAAGEEIVRRGELLDSVPYALAPSDGWHNVPALAEVVAFLATSVLEHGLLALHIVAVTSGLLVVARDAAARGARSGNTAIVLGVVVLGAFTTLFVVRLQLFSLLLFPVLVTLLRSQDNRPSRRVWWIPVLLAVWGNLHGAVLLGLAVTLTHLVFSRARLQAGLSLAVALASCLALLLTPAGLQTVDYYVGVARNEAARQHVGLWARLSPDNPFDIVLVACALGLGLLFLRSRPRLWERLAALGLIVAVLLAARNGVWLLMFMAAGAARGLPVPTWRYRRLMTTSTTVVAVALAALALLRGPAQFGASPRLVALTTGVSSTCAVYAQDSLAEQVVAEGGRVWITNPIDTFSSEDQRRYVRWSQTGNLDEVPPAVGALLVVAGGAPDRVLQRSNRHTVAAQDRAAVLYVDSARCPASR